jgi:hypothetical protein
MFNDKQVMDSVHNINKEYIKSLDDNELKYLFEQVFHECFRRGLKEPKLDWLHGTD